MLDEKVTNHESFGCISVNRVSSSGTHLFGSEAVHRSFIHLEISTADQRRSLCDDRHMAQKNLIRVAMTHEQWAQMVSSFGVGMGTPCTLEYVMGKRMADVPVPEQSTAKFREDLKDHVRDTMRTLRNLADTLEESNLPGNKTLGKKEQKELLAQIKHAIMQVESNIPFVATQFNEMMEKRTAAALVEIEGTMSHGLRELGLDALRTQMLQAAVPDYRESMTIMPELTEGENNG